MSYRVISLFSGCGGMDLGFKQAGFDIVWANDFYKLLTGENPLALADGCVKEVNSLVTNFVTD